MRGESVMPDTRSEIIKKVAEEYHDLSGKTVTRRDLLTLQKDVIEVLQAQNVSITDFRQYYDEHYVN